MFSYKDKDLEQVRDIIEMTISSLQIICVDMVKESALFSFKN